MTNGSSEPIIVVGGSVAIEFDEQTYTGGNGKYGNKQKKIASVEVTDDNTGQTHDVQLPANGKCTVRILTK